MKGERPNVLRLKVNRKVYRTTVFPHTPLLWVLRQNLGLTGTKYGCGMSLCGACTVHVNGEAVRSCVTPVSSVIGMEIVTIEGLSKQFSQPLQKAWIDHDVVQCGYCHPGQIMSAAALLAKNPKPNDSDIDQAMSGNICRCGTYQRIRRAIHYAAESMAERVNPVRNSSRFDSKPSGALNPAGIILKSYPTAEQRSIISNGAKR